MGHLHLDSHNFQAVIQGRQESSPLLPKIHKQRLLYSKTILSPSGKGGGGGNFRPHEQGHIRQGPRRIDSKGGRLISNF